MSRRVNGQGTVNRQKNGRWRWELTLGYRLVNGNTKRDSVSGTARTRAEAETALATAITNRDRGMLALPDRVTVSEFAELWLSRQQGLSKRSISTYKKELGYALEHIGTMKVRDVRAPHLKTLVGTLTARVMGKRDPEGNPVNPDGETMHSRTLTKVLTRVRALFREAVHDQIIYVNPCDGVKKPKAAPLEAVGVVLDLEQAARFHELGEALYASGQARLWPALFTAISVGLRRSEVMGLRWSDVDFERGILSIRHTSVQQDSGFDLGERTKTNHSRRDIEMPSSLKAMLKTHQAHQALERERAENAWRDSGAVFATALGWWVSPDNLNRALENLLEWSDWEGLQKVHEPDPDKPRTRTSLRDGVTKLERRMRCVPVPHRARLEAIIRAGEKLPEISPHDLRHTYATIALRNKVPVEVVSRTLGHSKISVTLDIYRHVLPSEMKQHVFDLFAAPLPVREVPAIPLN